MKAFLAFVLWSLLWSGIQRLLAKFQSDSAIYASTDGVLRTSCIIWDVCKFTSNLSKTVPILSGLYTDYTVFPNLYHTAPRKQISRTIWVAGLMPQSSPSSHSGFPHSRECFLMQHTTAAGLQGMMLNMFLYPLTRLEMVSSRTDCDLHRLTIFTYIYHRTSAHCRRCWGTGVLSASTHPIWLAAQFFGIWHFWAQCCRCYSLVGRWRYHLFAAESSCPLWPPSAHSCRGSWGNVMDPCHGNVVVFNVMHPQDHQKWVG